MCHKNTVSLFYKGIIVQGFAEWEGVIQRER